MPETLLIEVPVLFEWTQARAGGCGCVCASVHRGYGIEQGACFQDGEPDLWVHLVTTAEVAGDPVRVCANCYYAIKAKLEDRAGS